MLKTAGRGVKGGYLAACGVFIGDAILMFLAYAGVATLKSKQRRFCLTLFAISARFISLPWRKNPLRHADLKGRAATETVVPFGAILSVL